MASTLSRRPRVRPGSVVPAEEAARSALARFFRALADPTRLRLIEFLLDDERTVSDCVAHVELSQGRVSIHLACLADCGYVSVRREGRFAYYRVSDPRIVKLVVLARSLAADNQAALTACDRIERS